jgi:hypothetical protein
MRTERSRISRRYLMMLAAGALASIVAISAARALTESSSSGAAELLPTGTTTLIAATEETRIEEPTFGSALPVMDATDAVEVPGGWVVLDRRSPQLAFLDEKGGLLKRVSREGDGPGELHRPAAIAITQSTLAVIDVGGNRLDLFDLDGVFRTRLIVDAPGCVFTQLHRFSGLVTGFALLRSCTQGDGSVSALAEWVDLDGSRELIQKPVYMNIKRGTVSLATPLLAAVGDRVYLGLTPDPCIITVERRHTLADRICHPDDNPIVVPDSVRRQIASDAARLPATLKFVPPNRLPPFDDILRVGDALAFHVLEGDTTSAIEVARDGSLVRIVPAHGSRYLFGQRGILVAKERAEGTAFAVLPLP